MKSAMRVLPSNKRSSERSPRNPYLERLPYYQARGAGRSASGSQCAFGRCRDGGRSESLSGVIKRVFTSERGGFALPAMDAPWQHSGRCEANARRSGCRVEGACERGGVGGRASADRSGVSAAGTAATCSSNCTRTGTSSKTPRGRATPRRTATRRKRRRRRRRCSACGERSSG